MDWRRSYHETYLAERDSLRFERDHTSGKRRIYVDHDVYAVRDMSNAEIDRVAWRLAERALNEAIHNWNRDH